MATTTVASPQPDTALLERIEALERRHAADYEALERRVATLEAGPRDDADVTCLLAIARVLGSESFTSADVFDRAGTDDTLAEALEGADLTSPKELGHVLRRCGGREVGGVLLERLGETRVGRRWRLRVVRV